MLEFFKLTQLLLSLVTVPDLGNDDFKVREQVSKLVSEKITAKPILIFTYLFSKDDEVKRRTDKLLSEDTKTYLLIFESKIWKFMNNREHPQWTMVTRTTPNGPINETTLYGMESSDHVNLHKLALKLNLSKNKNPTEMTSEALDIYFALEAAKNKIKK